MKIKNKLVLILIAVFLLGGPFFYYVLDKDESQTKDFNNQPDFKKDDIKKEPLSSEVINAEYSYVDGKHTISGEVDLPSPCHDISVETEIRESYPEQVLLNFYRFNNTTPGIVCSSVMSPAHFSVTFFAGQDAEITAQTEGRPLQLNLTDL